MEAVKFKNIESKDIQIILNHMENLIQKGTNIFLLQAEIGVGKTFLISSYMKSSSDIFATSPSFSFINEYRKGDINIFHYDLYFRKDFDNLDSIKNDETNLILINSIMQEGLHFIEWGDQILKDKLDAIGFKSVLINILANSDSRDYIFTY